MLDRNKLEDILKENSYKLTSQRKAIIDSLLEYKGHFLTAEEIFIKTKEKYAKTNFSTIYRNLEILDKIGVIHKTSIKDGAAVYELMCNDSHHHHLICKGCGKTDVIDFCPIDEISSHLDNKDFTLTGHKFELYGYCSKCKE